MLPLLLSDKPAFFGSLGAALLSLIAAILIPRVTMNAIDDALIARTSSLAPYVWILLGLAVFRAILTYAYRTSLYGIAYRLEYDLRVTVFEHLTRMSFSFYDRVQSGQLISRANSDIRSVQMFLTFAPLVALNLVSFAVALVFMFTIHVGLTLVALATIPFVYIAGVKMRNQTFPLSWIVQSRMADVATIVDENVNGVRVVQILRSRASPGRRARERCTAGAMGLGEDLDDPSSLRASHGEPPSPRPRCSAAVRRVARHRRRDHRGRDRRVQQLRGDAPGALPHPRDDHDARPAGGGLGRADLRDPRRARRHRRPAGCHRPRRTQGRRRAPRRHVRLPPTGRGDPRAGPLALRPSRAAGRDRRDRRAHGQREVDDRPTPPPLLRRGRRRGAHRRARRPRPHGAQPSSERRSRARRALPLLSVDPRQHRLRPSRRITRRRDGGRTSGPRRRVHRRPARWLRHHHRRARLRPVGRATPADRDRPHPAGQPSDPRPRRRDQRRRRAGRGAHPRRAQGAAVRPHHARDRAPAVDDQPRRPGRAHRRRPGRRRRHARRAAWRPSRATPRCWPAPSTTAAPTTPRSRPSISSPRPEATDGLGWRIRGLRRPERGLVQRGRGPAVRGSAARARRPSRGHPRDRARAPARARPVHPGRGEDGAVHVAPVPRRPASPRWPGPSRSCSSRP